VTQATTTARGELLWEPSPEAIERSNLTAYMRWLAAERDLDFAGDYQALWRWSITELEEFWASIWDHFGVRASAPYDRVLGDRRMPGAQWLSGARLNYAENLLAAKPPQRLAIQHASELRELSALSWGELHDQVARCAGGLRSLGVGPGDRVCAYMPNICETVVAFLACASVGAIWSSCSPDFGARSVVDRFAQIEPKVLLCVDGYRYGGGDFDRRDTVAALLAQMPSVAHTVCLPYLDLEPDLRAIGDAITWEGLLARGEGVELSFEQLAADHPLWVLYSSGTTGLPKAIVQGHGGILLEQLKKMHLHVDAQADDRIFWFTTTGWMMWNFLVGALLTEASIVLYDGSPGHPDMGALWKLAERTRMTTFGTSASYVAACMKAGSEPARGRDLTRLRAVGSTGSPLAPEGFQWIYDHLGADTWLYSTSGGTDVCTAFVGGVPILPVYRGELQGRSLGAAIEAWDEDANALTDEVGELVITEPMPSMPLYLWNDPDGERYRESYFDVYPGIWRHGDWIEITSRATAVIYGRSDSTINRAGIRMGTSEIYRAVAGIDEVTDALVVDVPRPGTEGWMVLFVVLAEGARLDSQLAAEIRRRVREHCSPRHVPDEVHAIAEVPRTLSGKVLEVPVKRILMGTPVERAASRDSLANPAALDPFLAMARAGELGNGPEG
jgi:acetoacetyl-CoA synthetase